MKKRFMEEINVDELRNKIKNKEDFVLLDVRTEEETEIDKIDCDNLVIIPMQELPSRFDELDKNKEIILYCRSGERSYYSGKFLEEKGFNVKNLLGGMLAWKD